MGKPNKCTVFSLTIYTTQKILKYCFTHRLDPHLSVYRSGGVWCYPAWFLIGKTASSGSQWVIDLSAFVPSNWTTTDLEVKCVRILLHSWCDSPVSYKVPSIWQLPSVWQKLIFISLFELLESVLLLIIILPEWAILIPQRNPRHSPPNHPHGESPGLFWNPSSLLSVGGLLEVASNLLAQSLICNNLSRKIYFLLTYVHSS